MKLHWAGWETTTVQLQQSGWEISAEENYGFRNSFRLALRNQDYHVYGITENTDFDYGHFYNRHVGGNPYRSEDFPILNVQWFSTDMVIQIHDNLQHFRPIDAYPQVIDQEIKNIEDFNIFATPLARTEEIIVDPDDVADMMRRIKEIQKPIQENIRMKNRRMDNLETRPKQEFHAQILSIV